MCLTRDTSSRYDSKVLWNGVFSEETYRLRSTRVLSTKSWHEDELTITKHNGSSMLRDAIRIGSPHRGTWSDFLEPINEDEWLNHERGMSQASDRINASLERQCFEGQHLEAKWDSKRVMRSRRVLPHEIQEIKARLAIHRIQVYLVEHKIWVSISRI